MSVKTHPAYASTLVTASVAVNLKGLLMTARVALSDCGEGG